jgi:hypothetical protein
MKISVDNLFEAPSVARMTALLVESPSNGYNFGTSNVIAVRSSGSSRCSSFSAFNPYSTR